MSVVVADTSPLNYLVLISLIDLLPQLFGCVVIPEEVYQELQATGAPPAVSSWARDAPAWLSIVPTQDLAPVGRFERELDSGEAAAIRLALAITAEGAECLLLIDEAAGRAAAAGLGISNTGTLGILLSAARAGHIDLGTTLIKLQQTNFRISPALVETLLSELT